MLIMLALRLVMLALRLCNCWSEASADAHDAGHEVL